MAIHFDVGDLARVEATFEDADGTDTDPTAVYFEFIDPSDNTTDYQYGVDAEVVKSATGIYYVDVDCDEAGTWRWHWYSTGTGQAASEGYFIVEQTYF